MKTGVLNMGAAAAKSEEEMVANMTIGEAKKRSEALHTVFDSMIPLFVTKDFVAKHDAAQKSTDVKVVRAHLVAMLKAVKGFYEAGTGLKVGVIIPVGDLINTIMGQMRQGQPVMQAEGVRAVESMSTSEAGGTLPTAAGRKGSESTGTGPRGGRVPPPSYTVGVDATGGQGGESVERVPPPDEVGSLESGVPVYNDADRRRLNEGETKFTPRFLPDSQPGLIKKGRNRPAVSVVTNFSNSGMESYRRMGVARHRVKTSEEHSEEYGRVADPRARPNVHSLAIGALDNRPKKIITGIRIKT